MRFETSAPSRERRLRRGSDLLAPLRGLLESARQRPPWDDGAPIRAELFSVDRLEEHARSLASAQVVTPREVEGASLAKRLAEDEAVLLSAYRDVADAIDAGTAITPAAEWLIDNFHVVEKQIREVRGDLPPGYYRQLPKLAALRRAGGFAKKSTPFSEFAWADFPRRCVSSEALGADFEGALGQALVLARSPTARDLPGWMPEPQWKLDAHPSSTSPNVAR